MVKLVSRGTFAVEIPEAVIYKVLDIYPDENLHERKVFTDAIMNGHLVYADLLKECETLHIPWQLFLLTETKLSAELSKIDDLRKSKFDESKIVSRAATSHRISMRVLDRVIAFQQFNREYCSTINPFVGSLTAVDRDNWIPEIIEYFEIDMNKFNSKTKEKALEYLVQSLEAKNICVSRGVLSNKVLPASNDLRAVYKQSSGFVVQDDCLPFIFLPNEVNRNETSGRQIYTLVSLLILIGLGEHNILVDSDFVARVKGDRLTKRVHGAVAEMLLPYDATTPYNNTIVDASVRDELAEKYKLTPTAVVVTLRERGIISPEECDQLINSIDVKPSVTEEHFRTPKLTTSVEKFCGKLTNYNMKLGLTDRSLSASRAQYLMFGHIDKARLHEYKLLSNI